jgi:hypothetical protein
MRLLKLAAEAEDDSVSSQPHRTPYECNGWALYRDRTIAMLRKYFRMSLDLGRVPSLLGGELFRARVTVYQAHTFEDVVVFVHDMERCLERLDPLSRLLIARIVLQEYSSDEVAVQVRTTRRQVNRRLDLALDRTSEILVTADLMQALHRSTLPPKKRPTRVDCDSWWAD